MADQKNGGSGANDPGNDEYKRVALRFVRAHRVLLLRDPDVLHEFTPFRSALLDAAESPAVIEDVARALDKCHASGGDYDMTEAVHLLVLELEAFSASVERLPQAAAPVDTTQRPLWKRLLGIGKTATDSLTDILDKYLGPHAKAILKLLSEANDIVRGD